MENGGERRGKLTEDAVKIVAPTMRCRGETAMPAEIENGAGGSKRQAAEQGEKRNGGQVPGFSMQRITSAKRTEKGVDLVGEQRQNRCMECHSSTEECQCKNIDEGNGEGSRESISEDDRSEVRPVEEPELNMGSESEQEDEVVETQGSDLPVREKHGSEREDVLGSSMDQVLAEWSGDRVGHPVGGWLSPSWLASQKVPSHNGIPPAPREEDLDAALLAPQADSIESDSEMDFQQIKQVRKRSQQDKSGRSEGGNRGKGKKQLRK
ncbi:hypothetical protein Q8A73_024323 [Channa argus]|nr:hypothetical protein Q8A73_024323 [Channa argus]